MSDDFDRDLPGFLTKAPVPAEHHRRSPLVAFVFSLLVPGAGHFYAGKWRRGAGTLALFLAGVWATVTFLQPDEANVQLADLGFLMVLGMYVFGFLDSYFAVREVNDGVEEFLTTNPRVAAILNFLTNGFGYFYVGQRTKGIVLCISLAIANLILSNMKVTTLAPLLVVTFGLLRVSMAIDAYRIAQREGAGIRSVLPQAQAPTGGLPAAVPLTLAFVVMAGYLGLALIAGVFQSVGLTSEESGLSATPSSLPPTPVASTQPSPVPERTLENVGDSKSWTIPAQGLKMNLPIAWQQGSGDTGFAMAARSSDSRCFVVLTVGDSTGLPPLSEHASSLSAKFLSVHTGATIRERGATTLGNLSGDEVVYDLVGPEGALVERHVLAVAGRYIYGFKSVTTPGQACAAEADWIRRRIEIGVPSEE